MPRIKIESLPLHTGLDSTEAKATKGGETYFKIKLDSAYITNYGTSGESDSAGRDDNEPGLPGVTIYSDLNHNG